jgi:pilus assembly protein Flp/PilA
MMLQTLLLWISRTLDTLGSVDPNEHPGEIGQGLVEYALILVLVSVVVVVLLVAFGPLLVNLFQNIVDTMESAGT